MSNARRYPWRSVLALALLPLLGCGGGGGGGAVPQLDIADVGDGTLVVLEDGSLSEARPTNDAARIAALAGYLREHPELFGPRGAAADTPTFLPVGTPDRLGGPGGAAWTLVALHQVHMGAPILDEMQCGAFRQAPGGDLLQRVRGRWRDPSTLPHPPEPGMWSSDRVLPVVHDLVLQFGLSFDRTVVGEEPVISARHGVAGYLVTQFHPTETGSFQRFRAVIDPRDLSYAVLEVQEACDSCPAVPVGANVQATEVAPFFPPVPLPIRTVRIHAVRLSDGDGSNPAPITPAQVKIWVDASNQVWWPQAGIHFAFDDSAGSADFQDWKATVLNSVPADDQEDWIYQKVGNVWSLLFHHDKLVVFFRARGGGGWSWGPTSTFFISMPSYTNTAVNKPDDGGWIRNDTALSHEIGHYMGLAHPFSGVECVDAVPANSNGDVGGQDPNTTDDDVLDTAADMRDGCYATDSLTCTGGIILWNGQLWNPPWSNVMSYHDCLPETLSDDQVAAISRTLLHPVRANLLP